MPLTNKSDVWDFVQEWFPDYSRSDIICHNGDLQKLIDGEINGVAEKLLEEEYDGDVNNPLIKQDYNESQAYIFEESIKAYLESL